MPKFLELDMIALELERAEKINETCAVWLNVFVLSDQTLPVSTDRNVLWNI